MNKLSKIILVLCLAGTAFYSFKIFTMKETLNQLQLSAQAGSSSKTVHAAAASTVQAQPDMELQFSLSSKDVDLVERCKAMFTQAQDRVSLKIQDNIAQLQIQRRFPQSALSQTLALHQNLQAQGCLETQDSFRYQVISNQ
jgi:hypothetical protein